MFCANIHYYNTFLYSSTDPSMRHLEPQELFWIKTVYSKSGAGRGIPIPGAPILQRTAVPPNNLLVFCRYKIDCL